MPLVGAKPHFLLPKLKPSKKNIIFFIEIKHESGKCIVEYKGSNLMRFLGESIYILCESITKIGNRVSTNINDANNLLNEGF